MADTVADRIKLRMNELNIRQIDLTNKKVASRGTISLWLSGGAVPSKERLVNLANALNISESWILTGTDSKRTNPLDSGIESTPIAHVGYAPVISWVQAGNWTRADQVEFTGSEEMIPLVPGASRRSFYLVVRGISNLPYYADGEKICIDPDYSFDDVQTGEMIVVQCGGDATFKALIRSENKIYLKALNKDWQPNIMEVTEECVFIGKYVGSFKSPIRHTFN